MNKQIIENYLLVSGQARRHDLADLERRCRKAGFATGRTGQFGIGVLSYFMLADRLRVATRRGPDAKDADLHGWTFETEGIGSWGELRSNSNLDVGSRIELHLKEDMLGDPLQWYAKLSAYLRDTLTRIPCEFHLSASVAASVPLSLPAGWTRQDGVLQAVALDGMRHTDSPGSSEKTPEQLLPEKMQHDAAERDRRWNELKAKAQRCLRWVHDEGDLPNGVGRYRLHLPYFDLPGGPCLDFLDIEQRDGEILLGHVGKGFAYSPALPENFSWKGMKVGGRFRIHSESPLMQHEIDFHDDRVATLAINRTTIDLTRFGIDCYEWLLAREKTIVRQFVESNRASYFASLNARNAGAPFITLENPYWVTWRKNDTEHPATWSPVQFPAIDSRIFKYMQLPEKVSWNGIAVSVLPCVAGPEQDEHYRGTGWEDGSSSPHRIVRADIGYRITMGPLWERNLSHESSVTESIIQKTIFPPTWSQIVAVEFPFRSTAIWNRDHYLVRLISEEAWRWARHSQKRHDDPLALRTELLKDRARAAAWIVRMLELGARELWLGLSDRDVEFLSAVWRVAFLSEKTTDGSTAVAMWVDDASDSRLRVVTPSAWDLYRVDRISGSEQTDRWMPDPGPDWTLLVEREVDEFSKQLAAIRARSKRPPRESTRPRTKTLIKRK